MLMTINRCIDYTKASRGFKLVPKYETVDLMETLKLPLDCMKNIQERIAIKLEEIDMKEICSHIITDKQWLQENILCLLSNAVKYSVGGEVTIHVYLDAVSDSHKKKIIAPPRPTATTTQRPKLDRTVSVYDRIFRQNTIAALFPKRLPSRIAPLNRFFDDSHHPFDGEATDPSRTGSSHDGSGAELPQRKGSNESNNSNITKERKSSTEDASLHPSADQLCTHHLRFDIEDTGIGMSNEAMTSLFNPFRQAQRLAGGTGLGLYSLAKRMDAMHGLFGVGKRHDGKQGSLFWFSIPYRPDQTTVDLINAYNNLPPDRSSTKIGSVIIQPHPHHRKRSSILTIPLVSGAKNMTIISPILAFDPSVNSFNILLVDDSPSIIKMSSMMLRRQGHFIVTAENGQTALERVKEQWKKHKKGFDIILMDLQMPVMDGLEATRRLRVIEKQESAEWKQYAKENPQSDSICASSNIYHHAVIGVSANSDVETTQDALEAGFDAFMPKPFTLDLFNTTAIRILAQLHEHYCE
jgi:CheY-like chemotaxis protein